VEEDEEVLKNPEKILPLPGVVVSEDAASVISQPA
jgi:hypothetical protein